MWGGLTTVILTETYSDAEFEHLLEELFRAIVPSDSFISGPGDNIPQMLPLSGSSDVQRFGPKMVPIQLSIYLNLTCRDLEQFDRFSPCSRFIQCQDGGHMIATLLQG
jgi:hypothetical protein